MNAMMPTVIFSVKTIACSPVRKSTSSVRQLYSSLIATDGVMLWLAERDASLVSLS